MQVYTRRHLNEAVFTDQQQIAQHFFQLNIYGTSSDESSGDGVTSIKSWPLNVHYIRYGIKFLRQ